MSPKLEPGTMRLFDNAIPVWKAGTHFLQVEQKVEDIGTAPLVLTTAGQDGADKFHFTVETPGPLSPGDILAAYPTPQSDEASLWMFPHIVLKRRTFPWEVQLTSAKYKDPLGSPPPPTRADPWVHLLLLTEAEKSEYTLSDDAQNISVTCRLLQKILPKHEELRLLCHVRELSRDDKEAQKDDDGFMAMVVGNRLPAPGKNLVCLVSLENAWDADIWHNSFTPGPQRSGFRVLTSWTFTCAQDGRDFEGFWHSIAASVGGPPPSTGAPSQGDSSNGPAVQRFATSRLGHTPLELTTRFGELENTLYQGPLVPLPITPRDDAFASSSDDALEVGPTGELVTSYAAAFELGRLLALSSQEVLSDLQTLRNREYEVIRTKVIYTQFIEQHNFIPEWLITGGQPNFEEIFGGFGPQVIKDHFGTISGLAGDPSGLSHLLGPGFGVTDPTPNKVDLPGINVGEMAPVLNTDAADLGASLQSNFADLQSVVNADTWSVGR